MKQTLLHSKVSSEIQFRHMPKSEQLREAALQQIDSFDRFAADGSRCEVVFDQSRSARHGEVYDVALRFHIPGQPLYVAHTTEFGGSTERLFAALNDGFHDIRRQMIKKRVRRQHRHCLAA